MRFFTELFSFVTKGLLPYHGLGFGIKRALDKWSDIDFTDIGKPERETA